MHSLCTRSGALIVAPHTEQRTYSNDLIHLPRRRKQWNEQPLQRVRPHRFPVVLLARIEAALGAVVFLRCLGTTSDVVGQLVFLRWELRSGRGSGRPSSAMCVGTSLRNATLGVDAAAVLVGLGLLVAVVPVVVEYVASGG